MCVLVHHVHFGDNKELIISRNDSGDLKQRRRRLERTAKKAVGLGPVHRYPNTFENGEFCPRFFKKYASKRSVIESFSPAHTKTLNNVKTIAALTEHGQC